MFRIISTVVILFTFTRVAAGPVLRDGQGAAPKPSVTILDGTTDWALLRCEVLGAFPKPDVRWQNRAGDIVPAEETQVSERGGSYDIILQTTVTKTDHYRCVSTQEEINHQTHDEIVVLLNGAVPEPHIKILGETQEGVLLQCSVLGASPKPKVHWQNRAGDVVPAEEPQVSERGGSYDIILQTTVTKTDHYRCVSTQEEINHQIYTETYVPGHDNLFEDKSSTSTSGVMAAIITIILALVIALLVIVFLVITIMNQRKKLLKRWSRGRDVERDATQAEADKLEYPLPDSDAEPDEAGAEAGAGAGLVADAKTKGSSIEMKQLNGHQLINGSGSTQTTL